MCWSRHAFLLVSAWDQVTHLRSHVCEAAQSGKRKLPVLEEQPKPSLSVVLYPQLGVSPINHTDAAHPEEASQASFSAHTSEMMVSVLGSVYDREPPTSGDGSFVLCYHSRRVNTTLTHPPLSLQQRDV